MMWPKHAEISPQGSLRRRPYLCRSNRAYRRYCCSVSALKREVKFNSAVCPVMKYFRVLIAAFERQVKAIDWHLNQRAGLDRIEILVPHACEVPTKVGGTAALFALVYQPGCSEAAPDETIQIRV